MNDSVRSEGSFLDVLRTKLRQVPDADIDITQTLEDYLLVKDPAANAINEALAAIEEVAEQRVSKQTEEDGNTILDTDR